MKAQRFLLLILCGLMAACTLDEGDIPPRKTQAERAVYGDFASMNAVAMMDLRVIAGFDLYLRQTTDAGRLAVVKSVFGWAHISEPQSGRWTVETPGMRYDFVIKDKILLGEPDAMWKYYRGGDAAIQLNGELTTENGSIRYKWMGHEQMSVDWLVEVAITEGRFEAKASGSGRGGYTGEGGNSWKAAYRTDKPLVWMLRQQMVEGEMSLDASLTGNELRTIAFKAILLPNGVRIVTPQGVEEVWMD